MVMVVNVGKAVCTIGGTGGTSARWTWSSSPANAGASSTLPYSGGTPGPIGSAVGVVDPVNCFHLFLPSDFYDELLVQIYADQQREAQSDTTPWTPITKDELLAFIGINIAMGIVKLQLMCNNNCAPPTTTCGVAPTSTIMYM